ncbi:MAG: helix-turn-helix transcriptional regulator [Cyclobacteriaceae bacterium]|nr:helix-turn-helix transcriptional regulator [Cyclobacteriaceae bacterium]
MDEMTYGKLLKELRRQKGVAQRDLAAAVGVDFSYISKIENDRLQPPSADTTIKICEVLNVPSEVLLSLSGKVSSEIRNTITSSQSAIKFLNAVKEMQLTDEEWDKLTTKLKKLR